MERTLRIALLPCLTVFALVGCSPGPLWEPRIEGRVVDGTSAEPVPGALVVVAYQYSIPGGHGDGGYSIQGWEIADSSGRFAIPGRKKISKHWIAISYDSLPTIRAYHPRYGWTSEQLRTESGTRAIPWDRVELEFHDDRPNASGYYRELVERSPISSCDFADAALCRVYCTMTYPGRDGC